MKDLSIKGIAIGIAVMLVLDIVSGIGMMVLFAENTSAEAMDALTQQTGPLIYSLFLGNISTAIAGYIAARFGNAAPYKNSGAIGVLGAIVGMLFINDYPLWFSAIGFITVIPFALFGGYLIARGQK